VQIMIIVELPITLIGGAWVLGARLSRREWLAVSALTAGVVAILALADPRAGSSGQTIPAFAWGAGQARTRDPAHVIPLIAVVAGAATLARSSVLRDATGEEEGSAAGKKATSLNREPEARPA
jgi:drug/metabolite transporter (DMT)-like permease